MRDRDGLSWPNRRSVLWGLDYAERRKVKLILPVNPVLRRQSE
jgi:hypothetical protein